MTQYKYDELRINRSNTQGHKTNNKKRNIGNGWLPFNLSFVREFWFSLHTAGKVVSRFLDGFPFYSLPALSTSLLQFSHILNQVVADSGYQSS